MRPSGWGIVGIASDVSPRKDKEMVGPNGLEPSTSSVSRKRSNQTELRAYNNFRVYQGTFGNGSSHRPDVTARSSSA